MSAAWYIVLEHEIPGFDHAVDGKAVAKASKQLDSIAHEKGLSTLMSFFSISPEELDAFAGDHRLSFKAPASEKWFSADDGLKALNGLLAGGEEHKLDPRVISDLQAFKAVLEMARVKGVGWHLAVDF